MKATVELAAARTGTEARIRHVDVASDPELEARYGVEVPVLLVNGRKAAKYRVTGEELMRILSRRIDGA
jgi:hypothetical protein